MVKYIEEHKRLEIVEVALDQQQTALKREYARKGKTISHSLRNVAEQEGGEWCLRGRPDAEEVYDTINFPYQHDDVERTLVIERPWSQPGIWNWKGHRVSVTGESAAGLESSVIEYIKGLEQKQRADMDKEHKEEGNSETFFSRFFFRH